MESPAFADTAGSRCVFYRRTCGLPVGIDPLYRRITLRAGAIGAITMPGSLGARVRHEMTSRRNPLGPVIAHLRSGRWTFLCRPDLPDEVPLFAELFRLNVSVVPQGGSIALPSPADGGYRKWVIAPRDTFRPSGLVLIDSIRAVAPRRPRC